MSKTLVRRKTFVRNDRISRLIQNFNQAPLSHFDVDEFGQVTEQGRRDILQSLLTEGFLGDLAKVTVSGTSQTVDIDQGDGITEAVHGNGFLVKNLDVSTFLLPNKPSGNDRIDVIYADVYQREVDIDTATPLWEDKISDPVGEVALGAPVPTVSKIQTMCDLRVVSGSEAGSPVAPSLPSEPADDPTYLSTTPDDGSTRYYANGSWGHKHLKVAEIYRQPGEGGTGGVDSGDITDSRTPVKTISMLDDFLNLLDTPSSYAGQSGGVPTVNGGENALEFQTYLATTPNFVNLLDTPSSYSGYAKKVPKVNGAENALEWGNGGAIDGERLYTISTQTEFETLFGASWQDSGATFWNAGLSAMKIPANTIIIINPIQGAINTSGQWLADKGAHADDTFNGRNGYILRNKVYLSRNQIIKGFNKDDIVVVKNDGDATNRGDIKFYSTYVEQQACTRSGVIFTVTTGTNYRIGGLVHHSDDNGFYTVIATGATTVTVDRTITGASSGNLSELVTGVVMEGWSYDGRAGLNGLGGAAVGVDKNGGAFNIPYLGKSKLNLRIINHAVTYSSDAAKGSGGAVHGDTKSTQLEIKDVSDGSAFMHGGGVFGCHQSIIRALRCTVTYADFVLGTPGGGGVYGCTYSDIEARQCTAGQWANAGGVAACAYSTIKVYRCTAGSLAAATGVQGSPYSIIHAEECVSPGTINGGAVSGCSSSVIVAIKCSHGGWGAAAYACHYSHITALSCSGSEGVVQNCHYSEIVVTDSSGNQTGGARSCAYSNITATNCSSLASGGGAYQCTHCDIVATLCTAVTNGGGADECDYSDIVAIGCSITGTTGTHYGGGVYNSDYCNITAKLCSITVTTGNAYGGGAADCDYSTIVADNCNCTASSTGLAYGGGVYNSDYCTITPRNCDVSSATGANGQGGGAYYCDYIICVGAWINNSASDTASGQIKAAATYSYGGVFSVGTALKDFSTAWGTADMNA